MLALCESLKDTFCLQVAVIVYIVTSVGDVRRGRLIPINCSTLGKACRYALGMSSLAAQKVDAENDLLLYF